MIKFTEKDLYEIEYGKFDRFINKKLQTKTEYNQESQFSSDDIDDSGDLDISSVVSGDPFDFGDNTNDDWSFDGGGVGYGVEPGDKSGVASAQDWNRGNPVKTFLMSPLFVVKYVIVDLLQEKPKKDEWEGILKALNKINVIAVVVAILVLVLGLNSPFSPVTQLVVGLLSFVGTTLTLKYVYNSGILATQEEKKDLDFDFDSSFGNEVDSELNDFNSDTDLFNDVDPAGMVDVGDIEYDDEDEIDNDDEYENDNSLPESNISVRSDDEFYEGLLEAFSKNQKYMGREIYERKKILSSFSPYIVTNDRSFGKWKVPKERSLEYNNVAYSLYKGLIAIEPKFENDDSKLTVMDIRKNPLIYKIEVQLPNYFSKNKVESKVRVIEDILRNSEDDSKVSVLVKFFRGRFVFKFLRLDNPKLISLGDILRFKDDTKGGKTAFEDFADDEKGLPMLLGLKNNEYPYIVDLEENTSGVIIGGSGSGKSWLTFLLGTNLVFANDYNNVQFIVMDRKNAPFWNAFARFPHVLGYHTDTNSYIEILQEVVNEIDRRQKLMTELGAEDVKGYRKAQRKKGNYDELKKMPLLIVVIDEITATMQDFLAKDDNKESYNLVKGLMSTITFMGRSSGVRLLAIGQSAVDPSLPKDIRRNSTFRFGMKMDAESDFNILFGDEAKNVTKPASAGIGLARTMGESGMHMIKTLTVGGTSNEQILALLRVTAFDWIRRSIGVDQLSNPPEGMEISAAFNRNKFLEMSLKEMAEGRILNPSEVNTGYEVLMNEDMTPGYKLKKYESTGIELTQEKSKNISLSKTPNENKGVADVDYGDMGSDDDRSGLSFETKKSTEPNKFDILDEVNDGLEYSNDINSIELKEGKTDFKGISDFNEDQVVEPDWWDSIDDEEEDNDNINFQENNESELEEVDAVVSNTNDETGELSLEDLMRMEEDSENLTEQGCEDYSELSPDYVESLEGGGFNGVSTDKELVPTEVHMDDEAADTGDNKPPLEKTQNRDKDMLGSKENQEIENLAVVQESGYKKLQEIQNRRKPNSAAVEFDFVAPTKKEEVKNPEESIKQYIVKYGVSDGNFTYRMSKEEIESVYSKRKIEEALNLVLIVADGSDYIAEL
ncbi:FtsK/SpoIIIE domain-containing protein [Bacillus subtilis]